MMCKLGSFFFSSKNAEKSIRQERMAIGILMHDCHDLEPVKSLKIYLKAT